MDLQPQPIVARSVSAGAAVGRGGRAAQHALVVAAKRAFDAVAAGVLLVLLLPLIAAVALAVRLDSPGPCFFRCERVGYRGRVLRMLKFRKMHVGAGGRPLTTGDDERFTRIGRWLARTKLDELPQLWNVVCGQMSLVGPRPESAEFVRRHERAYREAILTVRPGMVGPSQIAFADESSILDPADPMGHYVACLLPQKVELDSLYARRRTLLLDLRILFWAAVTVAFRRPVAVDRRTMRMTLRHRRGDP